MDILEQYTPIFLSYLIISQKTKETRTLCFLWKNYGFRVLSPPLVDHIVGWSHCWLVVVICVVIDYYCSYRRWSLSLSLSFFNYVVINYCYCWSLLMKMITIIGDTPTLMPCTMTIIFPNAFGNNMFQRLYQNIIWETQLDCT